MSPLILAILEMFVNKDAVLILYASFATARFLSPLVVLSRLRPKQHFCVFIHLSSFVTFISLLAPFSISEIQTEKIANAIVVRVSGISSIVA